MDELLAADDFTISELCLIFGRCRETIRLWRKAGKIFHLSARVIINFQNQ